MAGGDDDDFPEDDDALWRHVTRSVTVLPRELSLLSAPAHRPPLRRYLPLVAPLPGAPQKPSLPAQRQPLPGLDKRSADRLKRGRMDIEAAIDLHGMTVAQAHGQLERFLLSCHARHMRCVLVITGKGRRHEGGEASGILRRSLADWLQAPNLAPIILRAVTAQPRHGGSGAFYILLRRQRG